MTKALEIYAAVVGLSMWLGLAYVFWCITPA